MKIRKLCLLFLTVSLLVVVIVPVSHASSAGTNVIPLPTVVQPIPTPTVIRPVKPDLMFVTTGCTRTSAGGWLLVFTVKNGAPFGFGLASGNFTIAVGNMRRATNSLAPQESRVYTLPTAYRTCYLLNLDPENRVAETNEANNWARACC